MKDGEKNDGPRESHANEVRSSSDGVDSSSLATFCTSGSMQMTLLHRSGSSACEGGRITIHGGTLIEVAIVSLLRSN
jgi:hypothetical protein